MASRDLIFIGILSLICSTALGQETTLDFDNPAPVGVSGALINGEYQDVDFGSGQWRWGSAYDVNPTNHIFFDSGVGTARSFSFVATPMLLQSLTVFTTSAGQLTLNDDRGQTATVTVAPGALQIVTTNWGNASSIVTIGFSGGWELGVDDIVFTTAQDVELPTVSLIAPIDGATLTGDVLVSALADDDTGVAGVWFQIDGRNLGAEDTTTPFERTWDTVTVPNGQYLLGARVRDEAGNQNASQTISVTVINQNAGIDYGLRFFGSGQGDIDRVKIPVGQPATTLPNPPVDVGAEDLTIEFWLRATTSENTAPARCRPNTRRNATACALSCNR